MLNRYVFTMTLESCYWEQSCSRVCFFPELLLAENSRIFKGFWELEIWVSEWKPGLDGRGAVHPLEPAGFTLRRAKTEDQDGALERLLCCWLFFWSLAGPVSCSSQFCFSSKCDCSRLLLVQRGRCFVNPAHSEMAEECLGTVGEIVCCFIERIKNLSFGNTR